MDGRHHQFRLPAQSRPYRPRRGLPVQPQPCRGSQDEDGNVQDRVRPAGEHEMTKLAELSSLIRSKNAGPFVLTFDIMFPDEASYGRVKRSGLLNAGAFAALFRLPVEQVRFFECDN